MMWEQPNPKKKEKKKKERENKHSIEDSQPSGILNKTQIPQMKTKEHKTWKGQRKKGLAENMSVTNIIISSKPTAWWVWTRAASKPDSGLISTTRNPCCRDMAGRGPGRKLNPCQPRLREPPQPQTIDLEAFVMAAHSHLCGMVIWLNKYDLFRKVHFPQSIYNANTVSVNMFHVPNMPTSQCQAQLLNPTHPLDHLGTGQGTPRAVQQPVPSGLCPLLGCHLPTAPVILMLAFATQISPHIDNSPGLQEACICSSE